MTTTIADGKKSQPSKAAIALGSNLGDSRQILNQTLQTLAEIPGITVEQVSSWYETLPVGPVQPNYLNGCAILATELHPENLLKALLETENNYGRIRTKKWGARTLDLDLILYNQLILKTPQLEIPHPRCKERAFVLIPLAEIAPDWVEPVTGQTIQQLLKNIDNTGIIKKLEK